MEYQRKIKAEELEISAIRRNLTKDMAGIMGSFIFICLMIMPLLIIVIAIYYVIG